MAKIIENRVLIIKIKPRKLALDSRKESARLWNDIVKLHKYIRKRSYVNSAFWKWPSIGSFEKHFKQKYHLHSQTIQAIIKKFFANLKTTRHNRKTNKTHRFPYKSKRYYNTTFKGQGIKRFGNRIRLPLKNKQYLWYTVADFEGDIVQAELGYNKLYLTIKQEIDVPENNSDKIAGMDVGIINTAVITDGLNNLAISGRGIRTIKQGQAKNLAKINKKISKTKKGSKRRRKLLRAKYQLIEKTDNRLRNAFHQTTHIIEEWCKDNKIKIFVIGDLKGINNNTRKKRRKQCNQDIGMMEYGTIKQYLFYKLKRNGIEVIEISERYTSQTCPQCGNRKKVSGRVYKCKCGYTGIRDLVGAYNIRNLFINNEMKHGYSIPPNELKYLRPIRNKRVVRSSRPKTLAKVA